MFFSKYEFQSKKVILIRFIFVIFLFKDSILKYINYSQRNMITQSNIQNKNTSIISLLKSQVQKQEKIQKEESVQTTSNESIKQHINKEDVYMISFKDISIISYNITEKEKIVSKELVRFYDKDKIEKIKPIINQEHEISLRLIDWTLTNYAKKKCIKYKLSNGRIIDVFESYKNYMTSYKRNILFDLFRRGKCSKVIYGKGKEDYVISGIKQLNSFRCVLEIELIEYIMKNKEKIETDMRVSLRRSAVNKNIKGEKGDKSRKKRQELSSSIYKKCMKHYYKTTITF